MSRFPCVGTRTDLTPFVIRRECSEKEIALSLKVDESVIALKAQCIVADSSRLLQIIINCVYLSSAPEHIT